MLDASVNFSAYQNRLNAQADEATSRIKFAQQPSAFGPGQAPKMAGRLEQDVVEFGASCCH